MKQKLLALLAQLHEHLKAFFGKIEESSVFERIMMFYEGLDPSKQKIVRGIMRLGFLSLAVYIVVSPILRSFIARREIQFFSQQTFRLQELSAKGSEVISQAPKPPGWQAMPASSSGELENSLRDYLANIGISEDYYAANADGLDRFNLNIDELTLKQALAITFQMDGWYPQVLTEKIDITVHPENSDRLQMQLVAFIPTAVPGGSGGLDDHDHEFESSNHEEHEEHEIDTTSRFNGGGMQHQPPPPPPPPPMENNEADFFENDPNRIPPPPPEFNENTPPPPNFDDGFDEAPPVFDEGGGDI